MRKRSRIIRRHLRVRRLRTRSLPIRRRGRKRVPFSLPIGRLKDFAFKACVWGFIVLVGIITWRVFSPGLRINAPPETVAALRVPHRAIRMLDIYAAKHDIPFAELFVLFCAENNFFPEKTAAYDLSVLERQYVEDFHAIKRQYNANNIEPYVAMFESIFNELVCFPIPTGWENDAEASFMYGDSWHPTHQGTDIVDRENIRGRVPVVSMTDGIVQDAGYSDVWGYHVGITTVHGNYYLYAHFDSLSPGITPGAAVTAGQSLGRMGDSGERKFGGMMPVHLHIGISPIAGFAKNRLWINPYPFLRYIESNIENPSLF